MKTVLYSTAGHLTSVQFAAGKNLYRTVTNHYFGIGQQMANHFTDHLYDETSMMRPACTIIFSIEFIAGFSRYS